MRHSNRHLFGAFFLLKVTCVLQCFGGIIVKIEATANITYPEANTDSVFLHIATFKHEEITIPEMKRTIFFLYIIPSIGYVCLHVWVGEIVLDVPALSISYKVPGKRLVAVGIVSVVEEEPFVDEIVLLPGFVHVQNVLSLRILTVIIPLRVQQVASF